MKRRFVPPILVISFLLITVTSVSSTKIEETRTPPTAQLDDVSLPNIMSHIQNFSSIPTRVTGYPGCDQAAQYITAQFRMLGLKVEVQEYPILISTDLGANITVPHNGKVYEAHPLWPNLVQCSPTPPGGIAGPIIYAGSGSLEEFDNQEVAGSIVLMEFNSLYNWFNSLKLGAKAVIFIEPEETTRTEAESKVILTPIYFPRVYVSKDIGLVLKALARNNTIINLKSSMAYMWRTAKNIIGVLEGETDDQIVILAAHYDSWSPVPSLAPDAFDAVQAATLLEVARVISSNKPLRTIWFLALSGHYQSVAGAREFVERYYFENETYSSGQKKIIAFADLSLATDSSIITWDSTLRTPWIESQGDLDLLILKRYFPPLSKALNLNLEDYVIAPHLRQNFEMSYFNPSFDSEPASCSGGLGFTYITDKTLRMRFMAPINQIDKIDLSQFDIPVKFVLYTFMGLANDDLSEYSDLHWRPPYREYSPPAGGGGAGAGVVTLTGRVDKYNFTTGFYDPVPYALVVVHRYSGSVSHGGVTWSGANERHHPIWSHIITRADENGTFTVHTLEHWLTGQSGAYSFNILGFVIDPNTGETTHAPDLGVYGGGGGVMGGYRFLGVQPDRHPFYLKTVVFECKSLTLFDVFDPYLVAGPQKRLNRVDEIPRDLPSMQVNEFASHTEPMSWGMISPVDTGEPLAMVFLSHETVFEVVLWGYIGGARVPVCLLNNASEANPLGTGIGKGGMIPLTGFAYLEGLYLLTESRHSTLSGYHVLDPLASEWHHMSYELMIKAKEALSNHQYSKAYKILYNAWNMEINAYQKITNMAKDVVNTSVAFYLILFPFAFTMEFLVFMKRGKIRLITILVTFLVFIILAYFIHPGFPLASNFWGSFLGLSVLAASAVVVSVTATQAFTFGKRLRAILTGLHYTEISRTGALFAAFSVGVQNMRKRRLRTLLTMTSILLLTASFVALTSGSAFTFIRGQTLAGETIYHGMLLTSQEGIKPFSPDYLLYVSSVIPEAKIIPRAWFFPTTQAGAIKPMPRGVVRSVNGSYVVQAVLGLVVDESSLTNIDKTLIDYRGEKSRWFTQQDIYACILPKPAAQSLSVNIGDQVEFIGVNYRVIGIVDDNALESIRDLDQKSPSPGYPQISQFGLQRIPISWDRVLIMPYSTVKNILDGLPYTIAVTSDDETAMNKAAIRIVLGSWGQLEATVGYNGKVTSYRSGAGYTVSGLQFLTVPFTIAALVIFTTILGSIYERVREIIVYSSVGLSPLHVAAMFFAESITYAVVGGVLGYLAGVVGIDIILYVGGIPPELNLNLSSSIVFLAIGISFLATILATIYPTFKVGRLVTPSLERKWKIKTKPVGNEWAIPLPFFATTQEEAVGIMVFMKEFLEIHLNPDIGVFWVKEPVKFEEALEDDRQSLAVATTVALPPWDSGFSEQFRLIATKKRDEPFAFNVYLEYLGGERHPWTDRNPSFVDSIRKQLLLWRGLKQERRDDYTRSGKKVFESSVKPSGASLT